MLERRPNRTFYSINTTKVLLINTSEIIYEIGTANFSFEATNLGSFTIFYGQSNLISNSGGLIAPNGSKTWDEVGDSFQLHFRVSSGGTTSPLVIQEYGI